MRCYANHESKCKHHGKIDFGDVQIPVQIQIYSSKRLNVQLISGVDFEVSLYSLTGSFVDIRLIDVKGYTPRAPKACGNTQKGNGSDGHHLKK